METVDFKHINLKSQKKILYQKTLTSKFIWKKPPDFRKIQNTYHCILPIIIIKNYCSGGEKVCQVEINIFCKIFCNNYLNLFCVSALYMRKMRLKSKVPMNIVFFNTNISKLFKNLKKKMLERQIKSLKHLNIQDKYKIFTCKTTKYSMFLI